MEGGKPEIKMCYFLVLTEKLADLILTEIVSKNFLRTHLYRHLYILNTVSIRK